MRWPTRRARQQWMAQRAFIRIRRGIEMGPCWLITLTILENTDQAPQRFCNLDREIRQGYWTPLCRRIRRRWRRAEAYTVVEFGPHVGVHLHIVIRGTYGLDKAWLDDALQKITIEGVPALVNSDVQSITDSIVLDDDQAYGDSASRVARYLTKQAWENLLRDDWGAHFRPFSATRKWLPREEDEDGESDEAGDEVTDERARDRLDPLESAGSGRSQPPGNRPERVGAVIDSPHTPIPQAVPIDTCPGADEDGATQSNHPAR